MSGAPGLAVGTRPVGGGAVRGAAGGGAYAMTPAEAPTAAVIGVPAALTEGGDYKRQLDDLTGKVRLADSDVEQYREIAAWADDR